METEDQIEQSDREWDRKVRRRFLISAAVFALIALGIAAWDNHQVQEASERANAQATQQRVTDFAFQRAVTEAGLPAGGDWTGLGHAICDSLDRGDDPGALAKTLAWQLYQAGAPLTTERAAYVVGASMAAYCPAHTPTVGEITTDAYGNPEGWAPVD